MNSNIQNTIESDLLSIASFKPRSLTLSNAWVGHTPFAGWLVKEIQPKLFVELGTFSGNSYFSFCQSIADNNLSVKCYAVDTWEGDEHGGYYSEEIFESVTAYNGEYFAGFSRLLRMTFDDAITYFADGTIDLLHIDGFHTYEAVKHDFETWLPKLSAGAVVLFHDINVRERDFGVWKFWEEIKEYYPCNLEFLHSNGLGVVKVDGQTGKQFPWLVSGAPEQDLLKEYFTALGAHQLERYERTYLSKAVVERETQIFEFNQAVAERDSIIARRGEEIACLNLALKQQDEIIENLNHILQERVGEVTRLRGNIASILSSRSWRITAPLRRFNEGISGCSVLVSNGLSILRKEGLRKLFSKTNFFFQRKFKYYGIAVSQLSRPKRTLATKSSEDRPLVSFVIPIYDRTDVLREAINSALSQTVTNIEVILVLDGSPRETIAVANEFSDNDRIRVFSFPTSSGTAVRGRNKGILEARGKYVAFLDSDDIATPDRIKKSLSVLEFGEADVVYGGWRALLDGTRSFHDIQDGQVFLSPNCDFSDLEKTCVPCQSTVTIRRDLFFKYGFLKPKMEYREDHELWARMAYYGAKFKAISDVLVQLRLHSGNNELNFKGNDEHWLFVFSDEFKKIGPFPTKILFVLPGIGISGGIAVVLKHANMLLDSGYDVLCVNVGEQGEPSWYQNNKVPVIHITDKRSYLYENIDIVFATFWTTAERWLEYFNAKRKVYFVQSDERLFYEENHLKERVARTYRLDLEFIVIANWLEDMLAKEFGKKSFLVPNGIDLSMFYPADPIVPRSSSKLRVLIEGPTTIPFKGLADAYKAVSHLDCEIWIVSSDGDPDPSWTYHQFFHRVTHSEMRRIYSACDIFLKMSRVESFSYPPLEAMACGCAVVVAKVCGGMEYIEPDVNAIVVETGDIEGASRAVFKLIKDKRRRDDLIEAGLKTVKEWTWEHSHAEMLYFLNKHIHQ